MFIYLPHTKKGGGKKNFEKYISPFSLPSVWVAIWLTEGKDTRWIQADTTCVMHQSSWVWSIQFLPEGDFDASTLTTWFGGPSWVTGRQWLAMTSSPSYCPFTSCWLSLSPRNWIALSVVLSSDDSRHPSF